MNFFKNIGENFENGYNTIKNGINNITGKSDNLNQTYNPSDNQIDGINNTNQLDNIKQTYNPSDNPMDIFNKTYKTDIQNPNQTTIPSNYNKILHESMIGYGKGSAYNDNINKQTYKPTLDTFIDNDDRKRTNLKDFEPKNEQKSPTPSPVKKSAQTNTNPQNTNTGKIEDGEEQDNMIYGLNSNDNNGRGTTLSRDDYQYVKKVKEYNDKINKETDPKTKEGLQRELKQLESTDGWTDKARRLYDNNKGWIKSLMWGLGTAALSPVGGLGALALGGLGAYTGSQINDNQDRALMNRVQNQLNNDRDFKANNNKDVRKEANDIAYKRAQIEKELEKIKYDFNNNSNKTESSNERTKLVESGKNQRNDINNKTKELNNLKKAEIDKGKQGILATFKNGENTDKIVKEMRKKAYSR